MGNQFDCALLGEIRNQQFLFRQDFKVWIDTDSVLDATILNDEVDSLYQFFCRQTFVTQECDGVLTFVDRILEHRQPFGRRGCQLDTLAGFQQVNLHVTWFLVLLVEGFELEAHLFQLYKSGNHGTVQVYADTPTHFTRRTVSDNKEFEESAVDNGILRQRSNLFRPEKRQCFTGLTGDFDMILVVIDVQHLLHFDGFHTELGVFFLEALLHLLNLQAAAVSHTG